MNGKYVGDIFLSVDGISLKKIKEIQLLVKDEQPLTKLNISKNQEASLLNYNIPTAVSYNIKQYVILNHPSIKKEWIQDLDKKGAIDDYKAYQKHFTTNPGWDHETSLRLVMDILARRFGGDVATRYHDELMAPTWPA